MMSKLELTYHSYATLSELVAADRELIAASREAAHKAHSPYSHFSVGAAARLRSGAIVCGANVESEVFPEGMCAERALLFYVASAHSGDPIESFAVSSISTDDECYPCGACRQALLDAERRQGSPIEVIMAGSSTATVVDSASVLLPFSFKLPK